MAPATTPMINPSMTIFLVTLRRRSAFSVRCENIPAQV
jgi:hypothetical protein